MMEFCCLHTTFLRSDYREKKLLKSDAVIFSYLLLVTVVKSPGFSSDNLSDMRVNL